MTSKNFIETYFSGIKKISSKIKYKEIENLVKEILKIKNQKGRIFFLGVGGSAGNASHAVNDFRKLCEIECYAPTDNVAELTARINDDGWNSSFANWLKVSNLKKNDAIFVLSVGGGDIKKNISLNLVEAIRFAKKKGAKIFGIVGRKESYLYKNGDNVIFVPIVNKKMMTAYSEAFQAVIWHSIVMHPQLQSVKTKW